MNGFTRRLIGLSSFILLIGCLGATPAIATVTTVTTIPADLTTLVNPLIGTKNDGNTFPGAALPLGMVQVSPDTGWGTGYNYDSAKVWGFSNLHLSGVGCAAGTQVPLMPTVGGVTTGDPSTYGQPLDHSQEQASPGYYKLGMADGVTAELTATKRTGWQRYTFPATSQANVLFTTSETKGNDGDASSSSVSIVGTDTVEGSVTMNGFCSGSPSQTVYFSAQFSRPFASFGTWAGSSFNGGSRTSSGSGNRGGWVRFDTSSDRNVTVKVGVSFTGIAGARNNLTAETSSAFDFDSIKAAAHDAWNAELHKIEIGGGTTDRQVAFYTSLYHGLLHPNLAGDVDGSYLGFDNHVHVASGYTPYQTFSLWDTYRGQNQLVDLLEPQAARDMGLSLLAIDRDGGWLPKWALFNTETNTMTGDPVTPFLVDIWSRGLLAGHEEEVYTALWKNANGTPPNGLGFNGRGGNSSYKSGGYVATGLSCSPSYSMDKDCQYPASATLEYAVADSALAIMAKALGHTADAATLQARGRNYRNLFDTSIGTFHPKNTNGGFTSNYNPTDGGHLFQEGGAYQYQWMVPQDLDGLIQLTGGTARTNARLDSFFDYPDLLTDPAGTAKNKWVNGAYNYYGFSTYNPLNEFDLLAPYTYLSTRQPYKVATVVRAAYTLFTNAPDGMTGNDDLGSMSAWYVFSSLGLYPLMNGSNTYGLSTPQFPYTKLNVPAYGSSPGGGVTINAPGVSDTSRYVGTAALNGVPFTKTWLSQSDFAQGGTLDYTVSDTPSTWGTAGADAPPSSDPGPLSLDNPGEQDSKAGVAIAPFDLTTYGGARPFTWTATGLPAGLTMSTDGVITGTPSTTGVSTVTVTVTDTTGATKSQTFTWNVLVPDPGPNRALNKPATGTAACASGETPDKAVNGSVADKFCSTASGAWLQIDLGGSYNLTQFTVKHAGAGGETSAYDTKAFNIQVSDDGNTWTTPVTVTGNTSNVTNHPVNVTGRYVRLNVVTPTQTSDTAARIYELEAYGDQVPGTSVNVALGRPATGSAACAATEGPEKAVNGSVSGGNSDKFCSSASGAWLQVDLGAVQSLSKFVVKHAGAGGEPTSYNTKAFDIQVSDDGTTWTDAVTVTDNTASITTHPVALSARYVRLNVTTPTQGSDTAARIYELEAWN